MTLPAIVQALAKTNADLDSKLKVKPRAPQTPTKQEAPPTKQELGIVAGLRGLALAEPASAAAVRSLTVMVAAYFESEASARPGATPLWQHLRMTPAEVARVFVEMVGENPDKVLSRLPRGPKARPGTGREGYFNGYLFERYMMHHVELHKELKQITGGHILGLNRRLATSSGGLFDVHETPVRLSGRFGAPIRATEFWLSKPRTAKTPPKLSEVDPAASYHWDRFIDGGYVAPLLMPRTHSILHWTLGVGLETKRPASAAKDMDEQVGRMLGRMQDSDMLKMTLDGSTTPVFVPTRAFVFDPESRWLVGATRTLRDTTDYTFGSSTSGGYPETYLGMRVLFDTGPIDRLSGLLFRARL